MLKDFVQYNCIYLSLPISYTTDLSVLPSSSAGGGSFIFPNISEMPPFSRESSSAILAPVDGCRRRIITAATIPTMAMAPTAAPTPMPAFAPIPSADECLDRAEDVVAGGLGILLVVMLGRAEVSLGLLALAQTESQLNGGYSKAQCIHDEGYEGISRSAAYFLVKQKYKSTHISIKWRTPLAIMKSGSIIFAALT